jgi:hypothetical protein
MFSIKIMFSIGPQVRMVLHLINSNDYSISVFDKPSRLTPVTHGISGAARRRTAAARCHTHTHTGQSNSQNIIHTMQRGISYAPHQRSTTAPVVPCAPMDSPFRDINRALRPFPRTVGPTTAGSSQYTRPSWHTMNSITCLFYKGKARQTLISRAKRLLAFQARHPSCTPSHS